MEEDKEVMVVDAQPITDKSTEDFGYFDPHAVPLSQMVFPTSTQALEGFRIASLAKDIQTYRRLLMVDKSSRKINIRIAEGLAWIVEETKDVVLARCYANIDEIAPMDGKTKIRKYKSPKKQAMLNRLRLYLYWKCHTAFLENRDIASKYIPVFIPTKELIEYNIYGSSKAARGWNDLKYESGFLDMYRELAKERAITRFVSKKGKQADLGLSTAWYKLYDENEAYYSEKLDGFFVGGIRKDEIVSKNQYYLLYPIKRLFTLSNMGLSLAVYLLGQLRKNSVEITKKGYTSIKYSTISRELGLPVDAGKAELIKKHIEKEGGDPLKIPIKTASNETTQIKNEITDAILEVSVLFFGLDIPDKGSMSPAAYRQLLQDMVDNEHKNPGISKEYEYAIKLSRNEYTPPKNSKTKATARMDLNTWLEKSRLRCAPAEQTLARLTDIGQKRIDLDLQAEREKRLLEAKAKQGTLDMMEDGAGKE